MKQVNIHGCMSEANADVPSPREAHAPLGEAKYLSGERYESITSF